MLFALRSLATALLVLCLIAGFAVTAPEAFHVSPRLSFAYFAAPLVGWVMAFFGGRLARGVSATAAGAVDAPFRLFGIVGVRGYLLATR